VEGTLSTPDVDEAALQVLLAQKRELTDEEIATMLVRIKPVVRRDGSLYYIQSVDPRKIAFTWRPETTDEAVGLKEHSVIHTLHTWGYYGMFKPSLAEVLSMISVAAVIEGVVSFETIGPDDINDLNRQGVAVNAGYHVANTILYTA
jgi:hypothetical protein